MLTKTSRKPANASKAAIEFLQFIGISKTKLEKELFVQLQDPTILALLKADALFVYATTRIKQICIRNGSTLP